MKKNILSLLFIMSFLAMFAQTATVRVQDGDATAIVGAAVLLDGTSVFTDGSGNAIFSGLADGTYPYTVTADCYEGGSGSVVIAGADNSDTAVLSLSTTNDVFVNLVPPGGIGFPPSGVTVRLYNDDLSYDQTLVTGGFTVFEAVPYGTYNYTLSQDCKVTVNGTTTVECTPGDIDALVAEFGINRNTNSLFFFVGLLQEPGCTISVTNMETFEQTTIVGQDILGSYVIENLPYGEYTYTVSKDCFVTQTGQVTVDCQPNDNQGNPQGNFVALDGMVPATTNSLFFFVGLLQEPGCTISVTNMETFEQTTIVGQDILGSYVIENLPYGEYTYTVSKDCFVTQTGQVTVDCQPNDNQGNPQGNFVALDGMVPATTNSLFFFVGLLQEPGCTISVTNMETFEQTTIVGQDILGSYVIENLPYGEYTYSVSKDCFVTQTGQVTVDCQPNDNQGNPQGNFVALDGMVPATTGELQFSVVTDLLENIEGAEIRLFTADLTYDVMLVTGAAPGSNVFPDVPYGEVYYEVSQDGRMTVTGTIVIECQEGDLTFVDVILVNIVGVTNTEDQVFDLNVFPNPFTNEFSIKLTSNSQDQVQVVVYDMVGRQVEQRSVNVADLQTTKLGINYPAGVYNIVVSQGDYRKSFLVVKK
ncbi:T9SS type A sorting domain-containing protein [Lewinella sp. LCG006]|uniref:T9SS type A sorting domain-containing protein n=1 Tax=Lewinella sp. LCG006 TaxID=3231911 RepID=UPI0034614720